MNERINRGQKPIWAQSTREHMICVHTLIRGPGLSCSVPNKGWWQQRCHWMHSSPGGNCEWKDIITLKGES